MTSQSNDPRLDLFWKAVSEAEVPDAAEMAAEERALQRLEQSTAIEPMPAEMVERLVARAVQPSAPVLVRSSRLWPRLLLAALLTVSVTSIALWPTNWVWPTQKDAPEWLDFPIAVQLANTPGRHDSLYLSALTCIQDQCVYAAGVLSRLRNQTSEPALNIRAGEIAIELTSLLVTGPYSNAVSRVDGDLLGPAAQVLDNSLSLQERLRALDHLADLMRAGVTALWLAPLVTAESLENRKQGLDRLIAIIGG